MNIIEKINKEIRIYKANKINKKLLAMIEGNNPNYRIGRSDDTNTTNYVFKNFVISKYKVSDSILGIYSSYSVLVGNLKVYSFATRFGKPMDNDVDIKPVLSLI